MVFIGDVDLEILHHQRPGRYREATEIRRHDVYHIEYKKD